MTEFTFTAVILTESEEVVQKQTGFKKLWQAKKWASRQIEKNHKIDEWYFQTRVDFQEVKRQNH